MPRNVHNSRKAPSSGRSTQTAHADANTPCNAQPDSPSQPGGSASICPRERRLLLAAVQGDRQAFEALVALHASAVKRRLAAEMPTTYAADLDVEDVLQVTFLEAYRHMARFRMRGRTGGFRSWLLQIARHNLMDAVKGLMRKKRPSRTGQVKFNEFSAGLVSVACQNRCSPSSHAALNEARGLIEQALMFLPRDYSQAIRMLELEGLSTRVVAQKLGRSLGAVHMLRARALGSLKKHLPNESAFFPEKISA